MSNPKQYRNCLAAQDAENLLDPINIRNFSLLEPDDDGIVDVTTLLGHHFIES